jgi:hypothetical protein
MNSFAALNSSAISAANELEETAKSRDSAIVDALDDRDWLASVCPILGF